MRKSIAMDLTMNGPCNHTCTAGHLNLLEGTLAPSMHNMSHRTFLQCCYNFGNPGSGVHAAVQFRTFSCNEGSPEKDNLLQCIACHLKQELHIELNAVLAENVDHCSCCSCFTHIMSAGNLQHY